MKTGKHKVDKGRRRFLKVGALAGAGLVVGVYFKTGGEQAKKASELWEGQEDLFAPNAWLCISSDDIVTIRVNHSEMGQGVMTALPMLAAEELEADWSRVRAEFAPAESLYKNPAFNIQMTGASTSIRTSWELLREAGAVARELLKSAAAKTWGVPVSECRAIKGTVIHSSSGRSLRYGQLAGKASSLPVPEKVRLKKPDQFKIIGKNIHRLDSPDKINGRALFGIDINLPGLLVATVVHPPVFGTRAKAFDASRARALQGVLHVLAIDTGIAVVADTFWHAWQGVDKLQVEWEKGENDNLNSEELREHWGKLGQEGGPALPEDADAKNSLRQSADTLRAVYELPYQAHATPEPMNCTAHVRKDRCDIWVPTQNQDATQEIAAKITGLNYERVHVHTTFLGGGFGRRIVPDYVAEAVQISKMIKAPVKVIWTREEDIQHDYYRPATHHVMQAVLNHKGLPTTWTHCIIGPSHFARSFHLLISSMLPYGVPRGLRNLATSSAGFLAPRLINRAKVSEGAEPLDYAIDNVSVDYIHDDPGVPIGFWRSVAHSWNAFAVESFIDEIAAAGGRDPFELRYELLTKAPRLRNVLKIAVQRSGWGKSRARGIHQGIAVHDFHDTAISMVADVSVDRDGGVKVHRVICAVDCGIVVNPKIMKAQMEGGIAFGLTAALKSAVTIRRGRVEQSNFDDFPLLRMDEMPKVEVHLVKSDHPPTGIGESAVPTIAPAVANAIYSATGKRIRKLPILPEDIRKG